MNSGYTLETVYMRNLAEEAENSALLHSGFLLADDEVPTEKSNYTSDTRDRGDLLIQWLLFQHHDGLLI